MADTALKSYTVTVNGHQTTMRLNETDAAAYGDAAVLVNDAAAAEQKAKARGAQNKARTAEDKTA